MENKNNYERWDFELDPIHIGGKKIEMKYQNHLKNDKITFEIKSERHCKWGLTGNVFVEFEQLKNGTWQKSGISTSQSDYYVFVLKDNEDNIMFTIEISTDRLKERLKLLHGLGYVSIVDKKKTSYGSATRGFLLPLQYMYLSPAEIQMNNEIKEREDRRKVKKIYDEMVNEKNNLK
jgi:hypothetical protein